MNDGFYRAFEERYYAPREVIKGLRKQYLPFTQQLAETYAGSTTFDAGCGRGEWLELMIEQGFQPVGVDLDDGMLSACTELQLPAHKGDAIAYMSSLTSESQAVVSAFHVVEHVTFEQLRKFVSEALRVLKPGGLLIMETPNPENLAVSTRNFYLDPTHQRPIPPQLLAFVAEFEGFERVKTLRLQEPKGIANRETIGLTEVINFVSPDYAVIAQKKADAALMAKCQELFDAEYGVSLDALTSKLDQRLARIESQSIKALEIAQQAEVASALQLRAVYGSRSWRITAPLRWLSMQARRLKQEGLLPRLKALIKKILRKINQKLLTRPHLRQCLITWSHKLGVYRKLKVIQSRVSGTSENVVMSGHISSMPVEIENMTPQARQIYEKLKEALTHHQKGGV
jgi:SAM-dependent methyltransferase